MKAYLERFAITSIASWRQKFIPSQNQGKRNKKIHNYTRSDPNCDYIFESIEEGIRGYMTAQGKSVKRGDCVILPDSSHSVCYQVEEVDYYCDPPDMWTALLKRVQSDWGKEIGSPCDRYRIIIGNLSANRANFSSLKPGTERNLFPGVEIRFDWLDLVTYGVNGVFPKS